MIQVTSSEKSDSEQSKGNIKGKKPIRKKQLFWVITIFVIVELVVILTGVNSEKNKVETSRSTQKIQEKTQSKENQALIKKRRNFDSKRGNNYEAASTAQGFIDIFQTHNSDADMYLRLSADGKDEKEYENGGSLKQYRDKVYTARLMVVINNLNWGASSSSDKKDVVAALVNALHTLYPNTTTISVTVNNGIRVVAEGNWNIWKGEADVKLK